MIDFGKPLTTYHGEPLLDGDKPLTLQDVVLTALSHPAERLDAASKRRRYVLGQKVAATPAPKLALSSAEATTLIEALNATYHSPLVATQASLMIDPNFEG